MLKIKGNICIFAGLLKIKVLAIAVMRLNIFL